MFVLVTTHHESGDNEVVCPSTEITNIFKPPNTKTTEPWYGCEKYSGNRLRPFLW